MGNDKRALRPGATSWSAEGQESSEAKRARVEPSTGAGGAAAGTAGTWHLEEAGGSQRHLASAAILQASEPGHQGLRMLRQASSDAMRAEQAASLLSEAQEVLARQNNPPEATSTTTPLYYNAHRLLLVELSKRSAEVAKRLTLLVREQAVKAKALMQWEADLHAREAALAMQPLPRHEAFSQLMLPRGSRSGEGLPAGEASYGVTAAVKALLSQLQPPPATAADLPPPAEVAAAAPPLLSALASLNHSAGLLHTAGSTSSAGAGFSSGGTGAVPKLMTSASGTRRLLQSLGSGHHANLFAYPGTGLGDASASDDVMQRVGSNQLCGVNLNSANSSVSTSVQSISFPWPAWLKQTGSSGGSSGSALAAAAPLKLPAADVGGGSMLPFLQKQPQRERSPGAQMSPSLPADLQALQAVLDDELSQRGGAAQ